MKIVNQYRCEICEKLFDYLILPLSINAHTIIKHQEISILNEIEHCCIQCREKLIMATKTALENKIKELTAR